MIYHVDNDLLQKCLKTELDIDNMSVKKNLPSPISWQT